jgi:hypothetical protein
MEIPFPDADPGTTHEVPQPLDTNPSPGAARPAAVPSSAVKPVKTTKTPKTPGPPIWKHPILKTRIEPILFIAIPCILLAILGAAMLMMRSKQVSVPVVDTRAEAKVAKEKRLREEGNRLLRAGRVNDAYERFTELLKLDPHSPAINGLMQKLSQIRQQDEVGKQQLAIAQQKFDQGLALYNQKKFAEAIPLLNESFHLNPNSDATAQYLKLAQQEDERVKAERAAARAARTTTTTPRQTQTAAPVATATTHQTTTHPQPAPVQASGPASLTTVVNSTVNDGYIIVRAGSDEVARENLWTERRFFRTHIPKQVNVTKEFPAKNADLDFWVVIPSLGVSEHRTIRSQNFEPGVNRKLIVTFDPKSKKVDFQFN